ncbi:MAG: sugar ABC transporter permease [Lachnospiraceae bacterium]|jgi:multiple sugar transport system permease protein|nr:sugar ABC transporter permease [Lachnospiraceae bacterium]
MMKKYTAFYFVLPGLLGMILFFIAPFVMSLGYAFTNDGAVGFDNFILLFGNPSFKLALGNTIKFMVCAIPLNIVIPLLIAGLLVNLPGKAARWLKTLFMSPLVIPAACTAFFFQSFFGGNGPVAEHLGVTTGWISTGHSFAIAVGVYLWKNMGYNLVLALAGLSSIPKEYYEWSEVEGMGRIGSFFRITIVYLVPTLFIMFVMSFISSFKVYRELYMLAGNYPNENIYMLQHYMNNQFEQLNYQNLTAAAFVITVAVSVLCVLFFILDRKTDFGE